MRKIRATVPPTTVEVAAVSSQPRSLAPSAARLLGDRHRGMPVWIRAPKRGPEYYCGFTRPKLYDLVANGHIRSVSIREPGRIRGVRLFHLQSILDYIERHAAQHKENGI
jgi:hypothetical protein